MGLVEEAQAAFRQSLADAEERKKSNFKECESSSERCAVRFKPVRDVILAILDVSKETYPGIRLTDNYSSITLWGQHYDLTLTFDCYEIRKNENEFAGEYQYHIYMDISTNSRFSLHFDEDEVAAVVYLTPKVLSDYMVYGTIPTHTIYYKINELNSTSSDNCSRRLQREILEMVTSKERVLFAKTLSYFYFGGEWDAAGNLLLVKERELEWDADGNLYFGGEKV